MSDALAILAGVGTANPYTAVAGLVFAPVLAGLWWVAKRWLLDRAERTAQQGAVTTRGRSQGSSRSWMIKSNGILAGQAVRIRLPVRTPQPRRR